MNKKTNYPPISDKLIEALENDFPDKIPRYEINKFRLGVFIGEQKVIDKLKAVKLLNEKT